MGLSRGSRCQPQRNCPSAPPYKLLIADVINGKITAVPRGIMTAGNIMQGARGGADLPRQDTDRVKSHLAKYYKKMSH